MDALSVVLLGIIEGVTEFLPISSTGHLIIAGHALGLEPTASQRSFDIAIQLGAILAAIAVLARPVLRSPRLIALAIVGFVPTGCIGFLARHAISDNFFDVQSVAIALLVGGVLLLATDWLLGSRTPRTTDVRDITWMQAVIIGTLQSFALIPGTSRSMTTIIAGLSLGIDRKTTMQFSFLLAIPTILAAVGYDLTTSLPSLSESDVGMILLGSAVSFITALATLQWLLRFLERHTFWLFGTERIALGLITLAMIGAGA